MTWTEFLIHILKAHAQTLHRLAAFFGEEELLEILEAAGDSNENSELNFSLKEEWLLPQTGSNIPSAFLELEGAVHDLHLSAVLEFHLWAYPFYRLIIESSANLKARIPDQTSSKILEILVEEAVDQAKNWANRLPVSSELAVQTKNIAQVPWVRFRTTVLEKSGRRPMTLLR